MATQNRVYFLRVTINEKYKEAKIFMIDKVQIEKTCLYNLNDILWIYYYDTIVLHVLFQKSLSLQVLNQNVSYIEETMFVCYVDGKRTKVASQFGSKTSQI